jgi:glycerol-3-phosphate dehydrogenase
MPITKAIYEILFQNKPVEQAIFELMNRKLKAEV